METIEELTDFITDLTRDGARGRLLARGEARSIIRRDGIMPDDAPALGDTLDTDLADYGFSVLRVALALKEAEGNPRIWRNGFVHAGNAFEALVRNGEPNSTDSGFYRVMGVASYHLAGYSALAYSMASQIQDVPNITAAERALILLALRDLQALTGLCRSHLTDAENSDDALAARLRAHEYEAEDIVQLVANSSILRAFSYFQFSLQTGDQHLFEAAIEIMKRVLDLSKNARAVPIWWTARVALNLMDDLWRSSIHEVLPKQGPNGSFRYSDLRKMFIAELFSRDVAEVELWPSQLEAAGRAVDTTDDLVVALPTSAGKTRIAELAALMTLSTGFRVLIVTPLRALSAQTERSFRKTFGALGYKVSSLYGAAGMAVGDEDALRANNIVIATPEKLDFALRNDPSILDDVALVVLDEGHLIGPSDREIRFENLVQRLLKRADSHSRRIVCLSAILPEGEQLEDLTAWIRADQPGAPIQATWRPTRQRFGTITWHGDAARLSFTLEADGPYIRNFLNQSAPIRPRRTPFPRNNKELTLGAAWKFSEEGKRTLIFCTQRDHVEGYAEAIIELNRRGYLPSLLPEGASIERAMSVGREWLGADHPALQCLPLGVAIHHARLPSAYLREVESLLASGTLQVIVASPTLAQGLNLNAAVLLIPTLFRAGVPISGEEFANVAGRAGRAFVDMEGMVLHVMYEPLAWRQRAWRELVTSAKARSIQSGIIGVVSEVYRRLARSGVLARPDAYEYLVNSQEAWFPGDMEDDPETIESLIERLDTTVLGLVEALDAESDELPRIIDEALNGSLWMRQVVRISDEERARQRALIGLRAELIWNKSSSMQRRASFAMGVGLEAGLAIDALGADLSALIDEANVAAITGDVAVLSNALVGLAQRLLTIRPFIPDEQLPPGWHQLLLSWVSGLDVQQIGVDNMKVIEDVFIYKLVWALEAVRMRRSAMGVAVEILEGGAAAALEAGVPKVAMAMLIRTGLPSRVAAMRAINDTNAGFFTVQDMNAWLRSSEVNALSARENWPTPETAEIWRKFRRDALAAGTVKWQTQQWKFDANLDNWEKGGLYRIEIDRVGRVSVCTPDFKEITGIRQRLIRRRPSLLHFEFRENGTEGWIVRHGPGEARWEETR